MLSEELFNNIMILYMQTAQGQGNIINIKRLPFFNLMLPWQPKKSSLVIEHINWIVNHPMIITAKYGSHHFPSYGENAI